MIKKYGKVTITEDNIDVTEFEFEKSYYKYSQIEALKWAKIQIDNALEDINKREEWNE